MAALSMATLAQLWQQAITSLLSQGSITAADAQKALGVTPQMVAIAVSESGNGKVANSDAAPAAGLPNTTGDWGPWQINQMNSGLFPGTSFVQGSFAPGTINDPLTNAMAAVKVYLSQGLGAWYTWTTPGGQPGPAQSIYNGMGQSKPTTTFPIPDPTGGLQRISIGGLQSQLQQQILDAIKTGNYKLAVQLAGTPQVPGVNSNTQGLGGLHTTAAAQAHDWSLDILAIVLGGILFVGGILWMIAKDAQTEIKETGITLAP